MGDSELEPEPQRLTPKYVLPRQAAWEMGVSLEELARLVHEGQVFTRWRGDQVLVLPGIVKVAQPR